MKVHLTPSTLSYGSGVEWRDTSSPTGLSTGEWGRRARCRSGVSAGGFGPRPPDRPHHPVPVPEGSRVQRSTGPSRSFQTRVPSKVLTESLGAKGRVRADDTLFPQVCAGRSVVGPWDVYRSGPRTGPQGSQTCLSDTDEKTPGNPFPVTP